MDKLESPCESPGLGVERDHRISPLIVSGAQTAVVVGTGAAGGNQDKVTFRIDSHNRPGVRRAALPRLGRIAGWVRRNGIPAPAQSAGARVEGPYHAAGHIDATIIVNRRADHDNVIYYCRR